MSSSTALDKLNNYLQSKNMTTSLSWQETSDGPQHAVVWTSVCKLNGVAVGTGSGSKLRFARRAAAANALASLAGSQEADSAAS